MKQIEEIQKKQTQVNAKLQTPKTTKNTVTKRKPETKSTPNKEPKPQPKPEVTVVGFLSFLKENVKQFSTESSNSGYQKVKINKRVYSYIKNGKRKPGVIVWNQITSKTEFIGTKKDMDMQLKNINEYLKA